MRRIFAFALLLFNAFNISAQQEFPISHFEIDSVQISPNGRYGIFRILPSGPFLGVSGEIYLVKLDVGIVYPLALQPNGLVGCLTNLNVEKDCHQANYGVPSFIIDQIAAEGGIDVVWGEYWPSGLDGKSGRLSQLVVYNLYTPEPRRFITVEGIQLPGIYDIGAFIENTVPDGIGSLLSVGGRIEGINELILELQLIDLAKRTTLSFDIPREMNAGSEPTKLMWLELDGSSVVAAGSDNGQWHIFNHETATITATSQIPIARIADEVLTLIQTHEQNGKFLSWQVAVADPTLSPEEAIQRARDLTNADAAESVRAALEAALIAEFSETGFSLHPGMTAIFDEFQIHNVLGVEREDTLLVPLEWRLAQPPEGASRPLDVEGPIPFPGAG